jgi:hypothetical protein
MRTLRGPSEDALAEACFMLPRRFLIVIARTCSTRF